ncbi:hypothetical protein GE061_019966 [Apolygus lucorum]|uniref:Uncharacterized protein n=1 Tax=Apolygus lucorum TaxID=248454 RepID=A0A8S9X9V2_APOLU|nr:hypothetical protein GE061_019966 [Apolygus lucorum]
MVRLTRKAKKNQLTCPVCTLATCETGVVCWVDSLKAGKAVSFSSLLSFFHFLFTLPSFCVVSCLPSHTSNSLRPNPSSKSLPVNTIPA